MAITVELAVNGTATPTGRYFTWTPVLCSLRILDAGGATTPIAVSVRNRFANRGGQLEFRSQPGDLPATELELLLPEGGEEVPFFAAGRWGAPSRSDGDAFLQVRTKVGNRPVTAFPVMVRVRKNANDLTAAERDRFLSAFARLNNGGQGVFQSFRDAHSNATSGEAHFGSAFLPWHRAFLLDLERELQRLDPSVSLPYWRFDRPAPRVFRSNYLGTADATGVVAFTPTNPLRTWTVDGLQGLARGPFFNTQASQAHDDLNRRVLDEAPITAHNGAQASLPALLESNPHGRAHVSFRGYIHDIETAARDPLFYLLHCNVDRLWAKWQWFHQRFDTTSTMTFPRLGRAGQPNAAQIGHNLLDTMWPWNNVKVAPRPPIAPRQPFPNSPLTPAPGPAPTVGRMIDYQGHADPLQRLGFDYDDVPYEPLP